MDGIAPDLFPAQEEGEDLVCPSCKDCLFEPYDDNYLSSLVRFYCKWKPGYHKHKEGVCSQYVPVCSFDEFLERYPHLKS